VSEMSTEDIREVLRDLRNLFDQEEIPSKDLDMFINKLKSQIVRNYLLALRNHSQPEQALKDSFFSSNSPFAQYLFGNLIPEGGGDSGFVDFLVKDQWGEVKLEIKPLFEAEFEKSKSGEIFKRIKKKRLNLEEHKNQIRKYLGRKGEFVVLCNLEEWYFFSKNFSLDKNCNYFAKAFLVELFKDFEQIGDFWHYLDRKEELSVKEPLDKKFFNSLKNWVEELKQVMFNVDEEKKTKLIIKLINKFIFIQTLDCFGVIPKQYIESKWMSIEREWLAKNKLRILRKFLDEINEYFYYFYDTELFRDIEKNILDYIQESDENIELFYKTLKFILGVDYGTAATAWERGITQYNFRKIDEDILGKAYETFLAEVRKEEGIYYTPKYITQYIVENTVGEVYNNLLEEITQALDIENFDQSKKLIEKFVSIKVLDPACGSGSFLIKALRLIWNNYQSLHHLLLQTGRKYNKFNGTLLRSKKDEENSKRITDLKKILNFKNKRDLISKIIIRHIHGNDKDGNSLEVAKVNIWLEAIKLAPSEFRYDKLPRDDNHILPNLEMNLCNGNSLVGLPEGETIECINKKYKDDLKRLFELRDEYLDNLTEEKPIKKLNEIKTKLKKELNEEFKEYLSKKKLSLEILEQTTAFYWAIDFWYVFFDETLQPNQKNQQGFDIIVGNPPYVTLALGKKQKFFTDEELKYLREVYPTSSEYKGNTYSLFIDRCTSLCKEKGLLSFIVPNTLLLNTTARRIRKKILDTFDITLLLNIKTKVFESAEVGGSLVFVFRKGKTKGNKVNLAEVKTIQDITSKRFDVKPIDQDEYLQSDDFKFYTEVETLYIVKKMLKNSRKLGEIVDFYQGIITGNNKKFLSHEKINDMYKPILRGRDIDRFVLNFSNTYVLFDKEKLWSNTDERFFLADEKLINRQTGDALIAAHDSCKYYTLDSTHVQVLKDEGFSLKYILGIFNSKLMNFYYKKTVQEEDRPFAQVKTVTLKKIPVKDVPFKQQQEIIRLVNKIINLKKLQTTFRDLWYSYSKKYRTNCKPLKEILKEDKRARQKGQFDNVWTSDSSVYPDDSEVLKKEFTEFKVVAKGDKNLQIYGIKDSEEMLVLKVTGRTKESRDIMYLELLALFDSRVKICTLEDIFSKSTISVIQPNIWENSGNLIKIVTEKFDEWLEKHDLEIKENNIVKIDNEIQEIDNLIDAHVFRLYGLTREEIEIVLDSLDVAEGIKNDIAQMIEGLK